MGMIANLLRVSNKELESYLEDSSLLEEKIDAAYSEEEGQEITDLDKAWGGLLFILTGQGLDNLNHPLAKAIMGGTIIDEEQDLGYGPGQYLTPQEVKEINSQIATISEADVKGRYNPALMEQLDIYPNIWQDEDGLEYILAYFEILRDTYATAAKNNEAIITFIN